MATVGSSKRHLNITSDSSAAASTMTLGGNGVATEAYVGTQITNLIDSSPTALNTLNELAAALGDDASFSTTVTNSIATKLPLAGGTLTGTLTGTYGIFGNHLYVNQEANLTSQALQVNGFIDITDVTSTALRWYNGSTFRGGLGTNAWAMSGSDSDLSMYISGDNSFFIQTNNVTRAEFDSGGLEVTGNISATNFSGSSSGTNTGDQTLPTLSSLGALSASGTAFSLSGNDVTVGESITLAGGLSYSGTTLTSANDNTTYSAGTGLTLTGTSFSVTANTYATAAQGTTADAALPKAGGTMSGDLTVQTGITVGAAEANDPYIKFVSTSAIEGTKIWYDNSVGDTYFDNIYSQGTQTSPAIRFRTNVYGVSNALVNALTIAHNGNVGIDNTAPTAKLQVGPGTTATGRSGVASLGGADDSLLSILSLVNTSGNNTVGSGVALDFHLAENYSPTGRVATVAESTTVHAGLAFYTYQGSLSEKMRITNAGTIRFNSYGAGILKTDANGFISLDTNTYSTATGVANNADVTPSWVPATDPSYLTAETFGATDVVFTVDGNDVIAGDDLVLAGGLTWTNSTKTLTSANDNTTYTAGTGLTLTGTSFSVTANTYAAASHTHAAGDITSGIFDSARIPSPVSGDWWNNGVVKVLTDGVMEVGKYMDWHDSDTETSDFSYRMTASNTNMTFSGTISASGYNDANWNTAYGWGDHGLSAQDKTDISNLSGVNTGDQTLSSLGAAAASTAALKTFDSTANLAAPDAESGTWTDGNSNNWGHPRIGTSVSVYNDSNGQLEFNVPTGIKTAYISHLTWSSGGYMDVYGKQADGDLVFLRRINTKQSVENSNHGNTVDHDGATIVFAGHIGDFPSIRIINKEGRAHLTGLGWSKSELGASEGTGLVHPNQLSTPLPYSSLSGTPTIPSGNAIIDWTEDQGGTNIHSGNYTNTTYSAATTSAAGLMSSTDKTKLNGVATGAEVNVQSDWNATTGDSFIQNKPTTFAPSSHNHNSLYYTEDEIRLALARINGWEAGYGSGTASNIKWNLTEEALELKHDSDTSIGAVYKAVYMEAGETKRFSVMIKGSSPSTNGMYLRLYQHDGDLPDGKTHVSNDPQGTFVQDDSRGDTGWYENGAVSNSWTNFERDYKAPASGYVSIVVLNWTGVGVESLFIKTPDIQTRYAKSESGSIGISQLAVSDGTNGQVLTTNGSGTLSFATVSSGSADTNYYLDGITRTDSTNTLVFSVSGATNQSFTFGANAFNSTTIPAAEAYTAHEDTSTLSGVYGDTANGTKIDTITVDANGHITAIATGATGGMTGFFVEDGDGTEVQINNANEWKFVEGTGIDINWSDITPGNDTDPYDLTFSIKDNSVNALQLNVSGNGTAGQVLASDGDGTFSWVADANTDTVYTHPTGDGNNHIPTGGSAGQFLKYSASGTATWATPSYTTNTDTVYTHPTSAGNKHIPSGGSAGEFLKYSADGTATWATPSYTTNTDTVYTHPTSAGNKHIPTGGSAGQFLKYSASGTATWATPSYTTNTNTTYSAGGGLDLTGTTFSVEPDLRDGITHVGKDANNYIQFDSTNGRIDFYAGGVFVARMESEGNLHIKGDVIAFSNIFS